MTLSSHSFMQLSLLGSIINVGSQSKQTLSQELTGQKCIKCLLVKPINCFDLFQTGGGLRNTCRSCRSEMSRLRNKLRKSNPPPPASACPICNNHTKVWILDHCHTTDSFRGYICDRCNRGLGCFGDNYETLKKAMLYLSTKH